MLPDRWSVSRHVQGSTPLKRSFTVHLDTSAGAVMKLNSSSAAICCTIGADTQDNTLLYAALISVTILWRALVRFLISRALSETLLNKMLIHPRRLISKTSSCTCTIHEWASWKISDVRVKISLHLKYILVHKYWQKSTWVNRATSCSANRRNAGWNASPCMSGRSPWKCWFSIDWRARSALSLPASLNWRCPDLGSTRDATLGSPSWPYL